MIVRDVLARAEVELAAIESARLDAELLLASSMETDRTTLFAYPEREVPETALVKFHGLLARRVRHYPVAYLLGSREFWSLDLKVDENTLIPRPETECLVDLALQVIPDNTACDILDLGCGSGAIALSIARERPFANVLAVDVSEAALAISRTNARIHALNNVKFKQSDWFDNLRGSEFDVIVSNPPYVESSDPGFVSGELRYEPKLALDGGAHGMRAISSLIPAACNYMKRSARFLIEHGFQQGQGVRALFAENNYDNIETLQDYAGLDRVSIARWPGTLI